MRKPRAKQTHAPSLTEPIEKAKWNPDVEADQVDVGTTSDGDVYIALVTNAAQKIEAAITLSPQDALDLGRRIYALAFVCAVYDAGQIEDEDGITH